MQGKTRSQKPSLELGIDKITCRRILTRISKVLEDAEVRLESCLNVEPSVSPLLGTLTVDTQPKKEATLSKLRGETTSEIDTFREEIPIEIDREVRGDTPVTMAHDGSTTHTSHATH